MMKRLLLMLIIFVAANSPVMGAEEQNAVDTIKTTLKKIMPSANPDTIAESVIPGVYEVVYGAQIIYMTGDGKFMFEGDVFDVNKRVNVTEAKRATGRKKVIDSIDEKSLIVFKPEGVETKYTITAFTDIDCGYCRKLHSEMSDYNKRGIEVRYAAFPRSGLQTPSYFKAVSVWCAKDQNKAMNFAKGGAKLEQLQKLAQVDDNKFCKDSIDKHFNLAREIGVTGTPTLMLNNGQVIPGYVPPDRLIKMLDSEK